MPVHGSNPLEFLQPSIDLTEDGAVNPLPLRKAFRVRGFSWFRANVVQDVNKLAPLIAPMRQELVQRDAWTSLVLPWGEPFSIRQVYAAATPGKPQPLKFHKAAQTLLLCEIAAIGNSIAPFELYSHMRIEPAVFLVQGLDRDTLIKAEREREDILRILLRESGQTSLAPIYDMADGKTVSRRLAVRVQAVLRREIPRLPIGDVVIGWGTVNASATEMIDGPSDGNIEQLLRLYN